MPICSTLWAFCLLPKLSATIDAEGGDVISGRIQYLPEGVINGGKQEVMHLRFPEQQHDLHKYVLSWPNLYIAYKLLQIHNNQTKYP